jgi:hypothetical protein
MAMNAVTPLGAVTSIPFDIREIFLIRAAARWQLVEAGEMELEDAIEGLLLIFAELVPAVIQACDLCGSRPCTNPMFCEQCRIADRKANRRQPVDAHRPTPQTTIEAIMYCVRERGPTALQEPRNVARLKECDCAALAQIDERVAKLKRGA